MHRLKNKIFYFTGTGNSLMVARAIGKALGNTEVSSVTKIQEEQGIYDIVGFVFPVYWGGLPQRLLSSITHLKNIRADYIFAIETHAGGPGRALPQLKEELQKIGLDLSAGFLLRMPSNYIVGYVAPSDQSIKRNLGNADEAILEFLELIRNRSVILPSSIFSSFSGMHTSYTQFLARVSRSDESFWVDDNCTACEICARICPSQHIEMKENRPTWMHNCELCLACINWCPERAIQYGSGTETRGRYTNPRITVQDMETYSIHF